MSTDLLSLFAAPNTPSAETVDNAKSALSEEPLVELVGVNSPEFEFEPKYEAQTFVQQVAEQLSEEIAELPSTLEKSFDVQHGERTVIDLTEHDDGLGDEEAPLTAAHTAEVASITLNYDEEEETEASSEDEGVAWYHLPLDMDELGLKTRTINTLRNAGYGNFNTLKGLHISELKEIKGMGQGCLDDIFRVLEKFGAKDWIDASRRTRDESVNAELSLLSDQTKDVGAKEASAVVEVVVANTEAEVVRVEEAKPQEATPSVAPKSSVDLKILVLGNASSSSGKGRILSFEAVYGRQISAICTQNNVPSIALIEYSKGWSILAANIRQLGWPQGVDVLCVSKSFAMRSEIVLELRLLADVVVEG